MKAQELIQALSKKLQTKSQGQLAETLGVSVQTLLNWKNRDEDLSPSQVAAALAKSRKAAVAKAQLETIKPIVEFYSIEPHDDGQANWHLFDGKESLYATGLKQALQASHGLYIFYDSRGRTLYVGKARRTHLWDEMENAFNRKRDVQQIMLVAHPYTNREFLPGHEKLRKLNDTHLKLYDLAKYFSAYSVDDGMIDDLEALLVRGFANDHLNVRMETFAHTRKKRK